MLKSRGMRFATQNCIDSELCLVEYHKQLGVGRVSENGLDETPL